MKVNFISLLIVGIIFFINDLIMNFIKNRNAKKCNYDCENCKNWDCYKFYCDKKRSELNDKENIS